MSRAFWRSTRNAGATGTVVAQVLPKGRRGQALELFRRAQLLDWIYLRNGMDTQIDERSRGLFVSRVPSSSEL